ncbi:MAG: PilZ domain-containing protein [Nitrospinae bacterium]|nr:PilZ domain-containing protein [Nitrospinota bacterium]
MERRKYKRLIFGINIYRLEGKKIGLTKDISAGGAFIETSEYFHKGERLNIVFEIPDQLKTITTTAIVMNRRRKPCWGIGIEFEIKEGGIVKSIKQFTERWSTYIEQSGYVPYA